MWQNYVKHIFLFNKETPLIFTQLYFWIFFTIVLFFYTLVYKKKKIRSFYIFSVSLFFYYKTSGFFFFLLIFSTLVDFFIGKSIYKSKKSLNRKLLVSLSIVINLLVLSYFKYTYFIIDSLNYLLGTHFQVTNVLSELSNDIFGTHFDIDKILLPVGISFYTFQTISYSVDIYRNKIKPLTNILDFGFYVSFFPQLVAGPIVRASEFVPQILKEFKLSKQEFGYAIFIIMNGLIKKMILADYIAVNFIDRIFANPISYSGAENLLALYGYSLQVYADFSGYTDIAIGVALLMGFKLPKNFNSPYKAIHVGEFWKRWHISLSSWLKDYLYIPLGGNRSGSIGSYILTAVILIIISLLAQSWILPVIFITGILVFYLLARFIPRFKKWINTNINIMITMLLGGLWHGASGKFILWGGLNGLGIVIYKLWRKISPYERSNHISIRIWRIFLTFNFITFTRIWFRSDSMESAEELLYQITHHFNFQIIPQILSHYHIVFIFMFTGFIIHWLSSNIKAKYRNLFIKSPIYVKVFAVVIIIFLIYQTRITDLQPFIYFQF
ncbi:MAG TPA: MBOAT family protein [Bacteroidales bacterium]|nr:MBOAT family protein [Bacteroidales bacterium]